MILKANDVADLLELEERRDDDPLIITPPPSISVVRKSGSASIDLRLGTWFLTLRRARMSCMDIKKEEATTPASRQYTKRHFVPFGKDFVLHPRSFALGITLEWVRLPKNLAAFVTGKSSWGRRGLIIATATGVHPGFTGCLTLEITNLGEIPIIITPGMEICQLFIHKLTSGSEFADRTQYTMRRRPILGQVKLDEFSKQLFR